MLCGSTTDSCDVCECSKKNKNIFKIPQHEEDCMDKENINVMKNEIEISLYENESPVRISCNNTSPSHCSHPFNLHPLEDHDSNSQDSGYSASYIGESIKYFSYASSVQGSSGLSCRSSSLCSMDDEFLDFADMEPLDDNTLPKDFNKLISGSILAMQEKKRCTPNDSLARPLFKRSLSLQPTSNTPVSRRARSSLFTSREEIEIRPFKRPEDPLASAQSPNGSKRSKIFDDDASIVTPPCRPILMKSMSTDETIEFALQRSSSEPDLIGDFSKTFCLPLVAGRHSDLKSITPSTLAMLMQGGFDKSVASFKVIDCRYPYEFHGGHISGAVNVFTKDQCADLLEENSVPKSDVPNEKRHILVFHCEFSSERGPALSRFLRNLDRKTNSYPALTYPEVYLLDGGYKSFFEQYSELCVPKAYKQMADPLHKDDLRHFRSKAKTWNNDTRRQHSKRSFL